MSRSGRPLGKALRQIKADTISTSLLSKRYHCFLFGNDTCPTEPIELLLALLRRTPQQLAHKSASQSTHFVPLLDIVRSTVAQDAEHLNFDYVGMHLRCQQLLHELRDGLEDDLSLVDRLCHTKYASKSESSICGIPGFIIGAWRSAAEAGPGEFKQLMSRLTPKAFAIVRNFAKKHGSRGTDAATERTQRLKTRAARANAAEESVRKMPWDAAPGCPSATSIPKGLEGFAESLNLAREADTAKAPEDQEAALRAKAGVGVEMMGIIDVLDEVATHALAEMESKSIFGVCWFEYLTGKLSPEEEEEFKAQIHPTPMYLMLKGKLDVEVAREKKRRSNKNKNKNRKLKQKAAKDEKEKDDLE